MEGPARVKPPPPQGLAVGEEGQGPPAPQQVALLLSMPSKPTLSGARTLSRSKPLSPQLIALPATQNPLSKSPKQTLSKTLPSQNLTQTVKFQLKSPSRPASRNQSPSNLLKDPGPVRAVN